ncbi:MAG: BrxE family protein [Nitrospirota bacterium]|nr:BrxE family protein [Nitrospirota bacterium]
MAERSKNAGEIIARFVTLRLVVGYLGSHKQLGWWDCDLLDATGLRFLETVFPRTARAAALRSTTEAACLVHDKALGRVGSYHLFRLPPALEDRLEHDIGQTDWVEAGKQIEAREVATKALKKLADAVIKAPAGPVQVGVERRILTSTAVQELAAHYHSAFQNGIRCFPYFAPDKHAR